MYAKKFNIWCPIGETNNSILCVKLQNRKKVTTKALYALSLYSFNESILYTLNPKYKPWAFIQGAYIWKDIWVSIQGELIFGGLIFGGLYLGAYIWEFTV